VPTSPQYADQKKVYSLVLISLKSLSWEKKFWITLGKATIAACLPMVKQALVNHTQWYVDDLIFKVGYGANKGIIPVATDEIFKRIAAGKNPGKSFEVLIFN
jgi:hypothetical protein